MSQKDKIINLNEEEIRTLNSILNLIIPSSEDRKMPGAADVGFFSYMNDKKLLPWIQEGLIGVGKESQDRYGKEFSILNLSDQMQLIDGLRNKLFQFLSRLTNEVIQCYYQHDDVLKAIGLEARPPYPDGYVLEDGDLTLLEPVYVREKMYRD